MLRAQVKNHALFMEGQVFSPESSVFCRLNDWLDLISDLISEIFLKVP